MTPLSSVAMLEKLALLRIAFCSAPVLRSASCRRTSAPASAVMVSRVVVTAAIRLLDEHCSRWRDCLSWIAQPRWREPSLAGAIDALLLDSLGELGSDSSHRPLRFC